MHGYIYIAKQNDNPFNNFLSLYFVIEDPDRGLRVKIPGKVELDPVTGQITTTFDDLPQFPVSDFQLTFKGGVRAALVNPSTCGAKTITADFYSWADPNTPIGHEQLLRRHPKARRLALRQQPRRSSLQTADERRHGQHLRRLLLPLRLPPDPHRRRPGVLPARRHLAAGPGGEDRRGHRVLRRRHRPGDLSHRGRRRRPRAGRPLLPPPRPDRHHRGRRRGRRFRSPTCRARSTSPAPTRASPL